MDTCNEARNDDTSFEHNDGDDDDESSSIYDSDPEQEEADEYTNESSSEQQQTRKTKKYRNYKPQTGSAIYDYLTSIKDKCANTSNKARFNDGSLFIPPNDPVCKMGFEENIISPKRWYLDNVWVFVWIPYEQFDRLNKERAPCIYCKSTEHTEVQSYDWRPIICMDKTVWVLHKRYRCCNGHCTGARSGGSRRTFAGIDPRALSLLPTNIAERFPYMTTINGPGVDLSLVLSFANIMAKGTSFGVFVNMINELHQVKHHFGVISYYDYVSHYLGKTLFADDDIQAFSAFNDTAGYCGMKLSVSLLKAVFTTYMETRKPYMQSYFQLCNDEGLAADDTFKFSKSIRVKSEGGSVRPFFASCTAVSLNGKVPMARLKYTKANSEMDVLLADLKKARINAGVPTLKRYETDNVTGDKLLLETHFPELRDGVDEYAPPNPTKCARGTIKSENITYILETTALINWCRTMASYREKVKAGTKYGLDGEWSLGMDLLATLQLSYPNEKVVVINLHKMGINAPEKCPKALKSLLEDENLVACGRQIGGDCGRLVKIGIRMPQRCELRTLALMHDPEQNGTSLQDLALHYLSVYIAKEAQLEDWTRHPLPSKLIMYAALDALISRKIGEEISRRLRTKRSCGFPMVEEPENLKPGVQVSLRLSGRIVAEGNISFVGSQTEKRKWGGITIGAKKALVALKVVLVPNIKPPILFVQKKSVLNPTGETSWDDTTTLGG